MILEVEEEGISGVKKVAKKYGVRRFVKPAKKASIIYKNPDQDIPYLDDDTDPSDKITLFMIYDETGPAHKADYDFNYNGNPAITVYVANYVREIREAYVQDVHLSNKDERQNQQGKLSGRATMTKQDEIEYFTSQQEFDPTIRSEIGEFLVARTYQPSPKVHIDKSNFFQILKKHAPKKYRIAVKKFTAGIQRYMDSRKTK